MKKNGSLILALCWLLVLTSPAKSQELFVFSEPASNMPANSIGARLSAMIGNDNHSPKTLQRYTPEIMVGLSKKWMIHGSFTISNMHQEKFIFESGKLYGKWRFLSQDEVHKHFRMAAFASASYSRNRLNFNETNLSGDQSGAQLGLIATQLWNKVAVSGTVSLNEILHKYRWDEAHRDLHAFESVNYSLSAGYLLFPLEYKDYRQTNLNLYLELLGTRNLDWPQEKYYIDLAPAVQFIFNSTDKLNFGYRYQIAGDISRMANQSFMISFEHIFLNVKKKKQRDGTKY